eukprot:CAMPEP_0180470652 /NCGR_PEP_ID=MMETSP1036_2-20121128/28699_1 /TAXON_ID=632150 /ORGANISM="Azadinium spinosum, Strain 3D9" /LENGTH=155 /DNA_ID=CAMNT_0022477799 /DNA_START=9 /DNA_END=477 /DNA_ORIENTATION=-
MASARCKLKLWGALALGGIRTLISSTSHDRVYVFHDCVADIALGTEDELPAVTQPTLSGGNRVGRDPTFVPAVVHLQRGEVEDMILGDAPPFVVPVDQGNGVLHALELPSGVYIGLRHHFHEGGRLLGAPGCLCAQREDEQAPLKSVAELVRNAA